MRIAHKFSHRNAQDLLESPRFKGAYHEFLGVLAELPPYRTAKIKKTSARHIIAPGAMNRWLDQELTKLVDSLCRNLSGEELPLFANQSEAIEKANADPVTQDLVKRLLAQGHDVNVLIVFGYTEEEKAAVRGYLDQMEAFARGERQEYPDVPPAFLPAIVAPESLVADLQKHLDVEVAAEAIQSLSAHEFATVVAYVGRENAITAEKGDAVTFDDLPAMPPAVVRLRDGDAVPVLEDGAGDDDDIQDGAADDEAADGVPVPGDPEVEF